MSKRERERGITSRLSSTNKQASKQAGSARPLDRARNPRRLSAKLTACSRSFINNVYGGGGV